MYSQLYYISIIANWTTARPRGSPREAGGWVFYYIYGQFSKFHVCFCGLDPGNLKFETVRTNKQHICFLDLRRSI